MPMARCTLCITRPGSWPKSHEMNSRGKPLAGTGDLPLTTNAGRTASMAKQPHRTPLPPRSRRRLNVLDAAIERIALLIQDMANDPRKLKPGEACRLLNSTPLGHVLDDRHLRKHRSRAGTRIGDGKTVDLLRYCAWLCLQPRSNEIAREISPDNSYESKKDRERERNATASRKGRDIAPLPECQNPTRRAKAEQSLQKWCETYLSRRFPLPWSDDHIEQLENIDRVITDGGLQAIAAPRGDGKTTRLEGGILKAVMTGDHLYAVLLTATGGHAPKRIASIKTELLTNDMLLADYPEICYPIRRMEGRANKCNGQLLAGQPTWPGGLESVWGKKRIVLPTVEGSRASGAVLEAAGLLEATRGLNVTRADGTVARPTIALLDDVQTNRSARSVVQTEEREEAVAAGIIHLCGPDKTISALLSATVIQRGDMADRLLSRESHPEWHGIRKQLLYSFPKRLDLWDHYADLYRDDLAAGGDGRKATRYYRANRKAMDEGGVVAWEHRKAKGELSALEHAMRLFIRDRSSFFSEMQNEPEADVQGDVVEMLTADQIAAKVSGYARYEIPAAVERLVFMVDVHKELLYYAVVGFQPGFTGHVIDYGTWPEQTTHYFEMKRCRQPISRHPAITAGSLEGKITQALDCMFAQIAERDWQREDGAEMTPELGLTDANWGEQTDTVYDACRQAARKHGLRVMPSHGVPFGPAKCPITRWNAKTTKGKIGDEWHIPPPGRGRAIRHLLFDAGRRKSFLHRRLATPAGDSGSLTLFHGPPSRHRLLSEHLTAESGTNTKGPYGDVTVWTLQPGRDNHWLDCLSGCCTAESVLGGKLASPLAGGTTTTKRKRRVRYLN